MKSTLLKAYIDNLILPLLEIFHSLYLVNVYLQQTFLKSQIGEQLQNLSKHNVSTIEDNLVQLIPNLAIRQSIEYLVHPPFFFFVLSLHFQLLALFDISQSFTQLFIEIDNEFTQTVLLLVCYSFIHSILELNGCQRIFKLTQIRFQFGDLSTNVTFRKDKFIILVCLLFGGLLVFLLFLNFIASFCTIPRKYRTQKLPLRLFMRPWFIIFIKLHKFLEFSLYFANIEIFLHI